LPGGELIDRLQNIAGNVADRQHLNSRRLPQWSNGSGALTSSCPKINLFGFLVHLSFYGNSEAKFRKKSTKIPETIDSVAHVLGHRARAKKSIKPEKESSGGAARTMPRFRVYDEAGNVIETHEHTGDFKEW